MYETSKKTFTVSNLMIIIHSFSQKYSLHSFDVTEGPNKFTIFATEKHDVTKIQIGFEGASQPDCKLVTKKDKSIDVTYTAPVAGEYKIHVRYDGTPVTGSPYKCKILGEVKTALAKVKVSGATKDGRVNQENNIIIDGRDVGIVGR